MNIVCGFCRAMYQDEQACIEHDIRHHNGLARMIDTHRICEQELQACICDISRYENIARVMRLRNA